MGLFVCRTDINKHFQCPLNVYIFKVLRKGNKFACIGLEAQEIVYTTCITYGIELRLNVIAVYINK